MRERFEAKTPESVLSAGATSLSPLARVKFVKKGELFFSRGLVFRFHLSDVGDASLLAYYDISDIRNITRNLATSYP